MKVKKAGTILINIENKKIGLVYRKSKNDYSFPKGHLEEGETLQECAVRETKEETKRENHLIYEKEIYVLSYTTLSNEETECYYYLAIDEGQSNEDISEDLIEELVWVSLEEVEEKLSYENLKELWRDVKNEVLDICLTNNKI